MTFRFRGCHDPDIDPSWSAPMLAGSATTKGLLMTVVHRHLLGAALLSLAACLPALADADHAMAPASFALLGDAPCGLSEEPKFDLVIDAINATPSVRLVVHTGDVKQGSERCDDEVFQKRFTQYQKFSAAFIVTPGDNDWTDCHRANNGGFLPTERLARFRQIFYRNLA